MIKIKQESIERFKNTFDDFKELFVNDMRESILNFGEIKTLDLIEGCIFPCLRGYLRSEYYNSKKELK